MIPNEDLLGMSNNDVTTDWFWEGNVANSLAVGLEKWGWTIESKTDTRTKQHGVDIVASKGSRLLLVEVKGYPSKNYRDPRRTGELKPTNPTNQAQQWYSHALLKALRLQGKNPSAMIGLGFPDFRRYQALFEETKVGLEKLGIVMLLVDSSGKVCEMGNRLEVLRATEVE